MAIEWHKPPFKLNEIKLEVTHKCTLTCIHCSSEATPDKKIQMSKDVAIRIAKEINELKLEKVDISGGEPLLWPYIHELFEELNNGEAYTSLYTAGNVIDFDKYIFNLKKLGLKKIIFSIFGGHEEAHEKITRSNGSFKFTLKSIKDSIKNGIVTELHFVPFGSNYQELNEIIDLAKQLKIEKISVLRFVPQGRGKLMTKEVLTKIQNLHLKNIIELGREKIDIRAGSPFNFLLINESPQCCAAIDRMFIGPKYEIYPCDAFKQVNAIDIVGTDEYSRLDKWTIKECWANSPYFKKIRDYLTTDFYEECQSCKLLAKCSSGCLAQKALKNADLRKDVDPMCLKY